MGAKHFGKPEGGEELDSRCRPNFQDEHTYIEQPFEKPCWEVIVSDDC